jgi:hypothetical protein
MAGGGNSMDTSAPSGHQQLGESSLSPTSLPETAKLTAIFPVSHVPTERQGDWQEHLVEQLGGGGGGQVQVQLEQREQDEPTFIDDLSTTYSPMTETYSSMDNKKIDASIYKESDGHSKTIIGFQGDFAASDDNVLDERTIIDIFGEAAKEFLTQRVVRTHKNAECSFLPQKGNTNPLHMSFEGIPYLCMHSFHFYTLLLLPFLELSRSLTQIQNVGGIGGR